MGGSLAAQTTMNALRSAALLALAPLTLSARATLLDFEDIASQAMDNGGGQTS